MLGTIKHFYHIIRFYPPLPKSMLKLEEDPPCESLGLGSISKINNIDAGGAGGDQFTFPKKSSFSQQIFQDILSGVLDQNFNS